MTKITKTFIDQISEVDYTKQITSKEGLSVQVKDFKSFDFGHVMFALSSGNYIIRAVGNDIRITEVAA